ncbi:MAG TPA: hypothetical protein VJK53_06260 [Candidatus Paceibacterota bacterium]
MQETIERLRQQPKEHRTAIAASIAIGVVAILMIGWFFFFIHNLNKGNLEYTRPPQVYDEQLDQGAIPPIETAASSSLAPATSTTPVPATGDLQDL